MTSEDREHVLCASHPLEHFVINNFSTSHRIIAKAP